MFNYPKLKRSSTFGRLKTFVGNKCLVNRFKQPLRERRTNVGACHASTIMMPPLKKQWLFLGVASLPRALASWPFLLESVLY
jgi:hypothetical protein